MKKFVITLIFFAFLSHSFATKSKQPSPDFLNSFKVKYEGKLKGLSVTFYLIKTMHEVKGIYVFDSLKEWRSFRGVENKPGNFVLHEYDTDEKFTGIMETGEINDSINGVWQTNSDDSLYSFSLKKVSGDVEKETIQMKAEIDNYENIGKTFVWILVFAVVFVVLFLIYLSKIKKKHAK